MEPLHAFKTREDLTLEEVIEAADALLSEVAPHQTRYAVNERPDVRTVRYYTTRGLLPKPLSYSGGRARYGFPHLVRLLAIKRMQADHFSLDQIARVLHDKNDDDVAALVARASPAADAVPRPRAHDTVPPIRAPEPEHDFDLELGGARVIVTAALMASPESRERVAKNLEEIARLLRATNGKNDRSKGGSDG